MSSSTMSSGRRPRGRPKREPDQTYRANPDRPTHRIAPAVPILDPMPVTVKLESESTEGSLPPPYTPTAGDQLFLPPTEDTGATGLDELAEMNVPPPNWETGFQDHAQAPHHSQLTYRGVGDRGYATPGTIQPREPVFNLDHIPSANSHPLIQAPGGSIHYGRIPTQTSGPNWLLHGPSGSQFNFSAPAQGIINNNHVIHNYFGSAPGPPVMYNRARRPAFHARMTNVMSHGAYGVPTTMPMTPIAAGSQSLLPPPMTQMQQLHQPIWQQREASSLARPYSLPSALTHRSGQNWDQSPRRSAVEPTKRTEALKPEPPKLYRRQFQDTPAAMPAPQFGAHPQPRIATARRSTAEMTAHRRQQPRPSRRHDPDRGPSKRRRGHDGRPMAPYGPTPEPTPPNSYGSRSGSALSSLMEPTGMTSDVTMYAAMAASRDVPLFTAGKDAMPDPALDTQQYPPLFTPHKSAPAATDNQQHLPPFSPRTTMSELLEKPQYQPLPARDLMASTVASDQHFLDRYALGPDAAPALAHDSGSAQQPPYHAPAEAAGRGVDQDTALAASSDLNWDPRRYPNIQAWLSQMYENVFVRSCASGHATPIIHAISENAKGR